MKYVKYNREERDICAHLFRLLLEGQPNWNPLKDFLKIDKIENPRLICEAALLRDAYHIRKPDTLNFLNDVCDFIAKQNNIKDYSAFRDLPDEINDPDKTHPKQICYKLKNLDFLNVPGNQIVYGTLQAFFNAKPDLVICYNNQLIIYEAKYTLGFDTNQLERTKQIAELWVNLLYEDLEFNTPPNYIVRKIGLSKFSPDISWEQVYEIALKYWSKSDFSLRVLSKVMSSD